MRVWTKDLNNESQIVHASCRSSSGINYDTGCSIDLTFTLICRSHARSPSSRKSLGQSATVSTKGVDAATFRFLRRDAVPPEAIETLHTITSVDISPKGFIDLTYRLNDPGQPIPQVVRTEPWGFETGDRHEFWVEDNETGERFRAAARLVYKTTHAYFFLEEGITLDEDEVEDLADRFETQIYPTNRAFFGEEWSPGVDNDPHVTLLFVRLNWRQLSK